MLIMNAVIQLHIGLFGTFKINVPYICVQPHVQEQPYGTFAIPSFSKEYCHIDLHIDLLAVCSSEYPCRLNSLFSSSRFVYLLLAVCSYRLVDK